MTIFEQALQILGYNEPVLEQKMTPERKKTLDDAKKYIGTTQKVVMDRPAGYIHNGIKYPINYGYIPGVLGGDGEELDVYVLGTNEPMKKATVKIIAVANRTNDNEDKLVGTIYDKKYTAKAIEEEISFQEKYFNTKIIMK